MTAAITGVDNHALQALIQDQPLPMCECPNCAAELQAVEEPS